MSLSRIGGFRVAGISTCVPSRAVANLECGKDYGVDEVRKVVAMAGVKERRVVDPGVTSADLCFEAADPLLSTLGWERDSITAVILVTQSPDYFLPSSSCMVHKWLGLSDHCAAFDVGLGCSGYPYGLYLAATMLKGGGQQRILMLHGETPSRFTSPDDHATTLLFGDAGSATALELDADAAPAYFCLQTDGSGYDGLILRGGAFRDREPQSSRDLYLQMDGAGIFDFTMQRVPKLIHDTLQFSGMQVPDVDWFLFHQSNRFIMKHLAKKCALPEQRVPMVLQDYGNCGGPSVALAFTQGIPAEERRACRTMMLGYGVGLSWSSAIVDIPKDVVVLHRSYSGTEERL